MALISCPECTQEVSDKAEACPKCAAPIAGAQEAIAAGTSVKTVQETSKKFKLQTLISVALMIIAIVIGVGEDVDQDTLRGASICFVVGFFWYIINRMRIWWHHK